MKRSEILFGILRVPFDFLAVFGALLLAYYLRTRNIDLIPGVNLLINSPSLPVFDYYFLHFTLPATVLYLLLLLSLGLYALRTTLGPWREMGRVIVASGLWIALVIAWFFFIERQLFFSRVLLLQATGLITVFVVVLRAIIHLVQRAFLRRGVGTRNVLSCGQTPLPTSVRESLVKDVRFNYLGHVSGFSDVMEIQTNEPIDIVLHTDPNPSSGDTLKLVDFCRSKHIGYAFLPPLFADAPHQLSINRLGLTPILRFEPTPLDGWGRVWKRAIDLVLGLILLILLSPILLIITIALLLVSGRPVFYVSNRVGQYGRGRIPLIKFRTMFVDADERKKEFECFSHRQDGPLFKIKGDPRTTAIGKFLRRWSLDELPGFINVVLGHLSLVGPRPHLPEEVAKYTDRQRRVFAVRPGITGLAQISGRSDLSFEEEVLLDTRYIEDWSLGLDLWTMWRTVFVVLGGKGAD
jgi:exopolysaccharide biosynthesis polyprenyl glycosylphosphotransferase